MLEHEIITPARPAPPGQDGWCLVLHGLGDSMDGWKPAAPLFATPGLGFIFVNAPDSYHGGYSWFDIAEDFTPDPGQIRRSRALLAELITHLLARLALPCGRLLLLGFSQGSLMVVDQALRAERRFAGVVGISGFMALLEEYPAAFSSVARSQRLLLTHGLHDARIPIAFARHQRDQLIALGVTPAWKEYPKEHSLDQAREVGDIRAFIAGALRAPPLGS
jgi:phospholipase/carboxylesterase